MEFPPDSSLSVNFKRFRWVAALLFFLALFGLGTPIGIQTLELIGVRNANWAHMVNDLNEAVENYDGSVGIYVKDLSSGRVFERNADRQFVSASLIKLPIMAAACKAAYEGRLDLNTRLTYWSHYRRGGSGRLKKTRSGNRYSVAHLMYKMITDSDNTATAMLVNRLGYLYLNKKFDEFGLRVTRIQPSGMSLSGSLAPSMDNFTTPREMGILLEEIYRHDLISDGLSDLMLEILKGRSSRNRLAKYLPRGWSLARKTGLLRKNCHDVGIVFTKKRDYIICVLTGENTTYREAKGFIASVGKTAYSYMGDS